MATRILRRPCLVAFLLATLLLLVTPDRNNAFFLPMVQGRNSGVARKAKGGAIMSFDNREDFEKNLNGSLTVAMFSSSMCGPCFLMEPKMEEMATKYANDSLKVVKISLEPGRNAKLVKPLYSDMEVRELPTFILFKDGEQKGRISGTRYAELSDMVEGLL